MEGRCSKALERIRLEVWGCWRSSRAPFVCGTATYGFGIGRSNPIATVIGDTLKKMWQAWCTLVSADNPDRPEARAIQ